MAAFGGFFGSVVDAIRKRTAAFSAKRQERKIGQRIGQWKATHAGWEAVDPRRSTKHMSADELQEYARELRLESTREVRAAGVRTEDGKELLDASLFQEYAELWRKREAEKEAALEQTRLKSFPQKQQIALVDIDPETGEIRPGYGGNFVLQKFGDVQVPTSSAVLKRRVEQMRGWKSIEERMDISEDNVARKLSVIDENLVDDWNRLTRAQKQHLINNEKIFDIMNLFTISTKEAEVRAYARANRDRYRAQLINLSLMIRETSHIE